MKLLLLKSSFLTLSFFRSTLAPLLSIKSFSIVVIFCSLAATLTSCSSVSINDYTKNNPKFIPQEFFNGDLTAHGVVKNRSGKVTRYFSATIKASWQNNIGTLDEKFIFDDGEVQYRTWTLTPSSTNANQFSARAGDVIGTGKGSFSGNVTTLNYVLAVKLKDSTINLTVDDWMWLVNPKTVINESTLTKFGFKVGSIQLVMEKN